MIRCILLFCALVALSSANATQLKMLTVEELTAAGEVIVHGVVTSKTCERDADGRIITRVELDIREHFKGPGNAISIVHGGGVLGDRAVFADGQEQYEVGEEVVAFLRLNSRGEGVTIGMCQGKFHVNRQAGKTTVYNVFHGVTRNSKEAKQGGKELTLEDLKARVKKGA